MDDKYPISIKLTNTIIC